VREENMTDGKQASKSKDGHEYTGTLKSINPNTIDIMVDLIVETIKKIGASTTTEVGNYHGRSGTWASGYLREAVRRGLLARSRGRPVIYQLPLRPGSVQDVLRGDAGEREQVSFYMDKNALRKLEALSVYEFKTPTGGRELVISKLIDQRVERLTKEGIPLDRILEEHLRHEQAMAELLTESGDARNSTGA
jgi:hypothetical protein